MTIAQLSPNSVAASTAYVNPQVKADLATANPQISQDSRKTVRGVKSDTVTISPQALQKLAGDGSNNAMKVKKTSADKVAETFRRKV